LPALGNKQLGAVTKADGKVFLADIRAAGKGAATINAVRRLLHRLFAVAVEEDRIAKNPVSGVEVQRVDPREPRFLTQDEVRSIVVEVPDRYRALVFFLAFTRLRIGEASALRVKNLDLMTRAVRVVESSPEVGGRKYVGPTKTSKPRTVRLAPGWRRSLKPTWLPTAGRLTRSLSFSRAREASRSGRTTSANEQLGHSHTTMTDRYTHLFPEDRERKVAALDALLMTETA
jgi:integrase